jgi:Na+/melibiose symporter-like transporter
MNIIIYCIIYYLPYFYIKERSSEENEASRRMKTEFLVKLDGLSNSSSQ